MAYQASADDQLCLAEVMHAFGPFREEALLRSSDADRGSWNLPLAAMGMAADNQIAVDLPVQIYPVRTMAS